MRDPARPAGVAKVLRLVADDHIWMEDVALPDFGIAEDRNVSDQAGPEPIRMRPSSIQNGPIATPSASSTSPMIAALGWTVAPG